MIWVLILCCFTVKAEIEHLTGLKGSQHHELHSKLLDHDYHIFVNVPAVDPADKNQKFPVVYLLDGGVHFPAFVPYSHFMTLFDEMPPVVLVGISYGTSDWQHGNKRSHDFTLPAESREHYGGAEKFHQFMVEELLPMIEEKYPVNPQQRILFGHSLGGQFALYSAMFQPQTFSGLIASNPAIHRNTESFMKPTKATTHRPKLFIMQAEHDNAVYIQPRKKWLDFWRNKPHHWHQEVMEAKGHNHMSSVVAAFRQGMKWQFKNQQ